MERSYRALNFIRVASLGRISALHRPPSSRRPRIYTTTRDTTSEVVSRTFRNANRGLTIAGGRFSV